jgi:5'-3' exonuclease
MGIPYYFYILTKKYEDILLTNINFKPDIIYFDFNGIIHPISSKNNSTNDIVFDNLWIFIENNIDKFNPNKITICVDGIAPLAKIIQQRKRRYLSNYRKIIDEENTSWDSNCITPGTDFMNQLNIFMKNKIRYNTKSCIINYNGSENNGEGEHKIFNYIKINDNNKKIIIHGLDADLIILSLMSHKDNIYLMREKEEKDKLDYKYVNISKLRYAIINDLIFHWNLDKNLYLDIFSNDSINLIESYCVMCSLLGNDFIPHLLTINLKNNGLENLINITNKAINHYGLLVNNGIINYKCLTEIFNLLSQTEEKDIFMINRNYLNKNFTDSSNKSEYYALKNKDNIAKDIYSNTKTWKYIYYKNKFNVNIYINSYIINNASFNYIKGIFWTYSYYKNNIIDHEWYYPYNYPPTIKDISNYLYGNEMPIIEKMGEYITNELQLLIVIPKTSKNLLNNKLQKIMEDKTLGLYHMFPLKYKIHTYLKTHLWECFPELPKINIELMKNILKSI